jgi:hypothetical protein
MDVSKYHIKLSFSELKKIYMFFPYALYLKYRDLYVSMGTIIDNMEGVMDNKEIFIIEFSDDEMCSFIELVDYIKHDIDVNDVNDVNDIIKEYRISENIKKVRQRYNRRKQ